MRTSNIPAKLNNNQVLHIHKHHRTAAEVEMHKDCNPLIIMAYEELNGE